MRFKVVSAGERTCAKYDAGKVFCEVVEPSLCLHGIVGAAPAWFT